MRTKFFRHGTGISMLIASAAFLMPLALAGRTQAATTSQCVGQHTSCLQNCNRYPNGPFFSSCMQRCGSQLDTCLSNALTDTPGKVDTPPDPRRPKGTDNRAPVGNAKNVSSTQPKANETPTGGGGFQARKSGGGNNGKQSNGDNGASFRFNGRN